MVSGSTPLVPTADYGAADHSSCGETASPSTLYLYLRRSIKSSGLLLMLSDMATAPHACLATMSYECNLKDFACIYKLQSMRLHQFLLLGLHADDVACCDRQSKCQRKSA